MHSISRQWLASAALSVLGTCGIGSQAAEPSTQVRFDHSDRCQFFYTNCSGSQDTASITFRSSSGETEYGITKFSEQGHNRFFDQKFRLGNVGHLHGLAEWNTQADGLKAHIKKQFYIGENAGISLGAYAGKINAAINLNAQIDLHTRPFSFDIPAVRIPAVPQLGISARDIPGRHIDIAGIDRTLIQDQRTASGSSPYGGLTLDGGYGYRISPRITGIIGQSANIGFDGLWATLNAGVILSSSAVHNTRTPMGNVCQGRAAFPKEGFNVMANICARRVFKDPLYDLEYKKAGEIGTRIGQHLANAADRIDERTGYRPATPTYSAERVLGVLGIDSPYQLQQSLNLSIAGRTGNILYAAGIEQPIGKAKSKGRSVNVSVAYEF